MAVLLYRPSLVVMLLLLGLATSTATIINTPASQIRADHTQHQSTSLKSEHTSRLMVTVPSLPPTDSADRVISVLKACLGLAIIVAIFSILFDKLAGVESLQVVQTLFFSVSLMGNSPHYSFEGISALRYVNGYNSLFDDWPNLISFSSEPSSTQSVALMQVHTIFPQNCNVMLWMHGVIWLGGNLIFLIGKLAKSKAADTAAGFLLTELSLFLCLFNAMNVGFSLGISFLYWQQAQPQELAAQLLCVGSLVLTLVVIVMYSLLVLMKPDLFAHTVLPLKKDRLSQSQPAILYAFRIVIGLLLGLLVNFKYACAVVLAMHSLFLVYLLVKRPYESNTSTIRSTLNELTNIAVVALFLYNQLFGQLDDPIAEASAWLVFANVIVNLAVILVPVVQFFTQKPATKKESNEATVENINKEHNRRGVEGVSFDELNYLESRPAPRKTGPEYAQFEDTISSRQKSERISQDPSSIKNKRPNHTVIKAEKVEGSGTKAPSLSKQSAVAGHQISALDNANTLKAAKTASEPVLRKREIRVQPIQLLEPVDSDVKLPIYQTQEIASGFWEKYGKVRPLRKRRAEREEAQEPQQTHFESAPKIRYRKQLAALDERNRSKDKAEPPKDSRWNI